MIQLSQEERTVFTQWTAYILSRCDEDRSWEDVLVGAYCEFMPGADEAQGRLVVQHILDTMSEFETAYDLSKTQSEDFAAYYLTEEARTKAEAFAARAGMAEDDGERLENIIKESGSYPSQLRIAYGDNAFRSLSALVLYIMAVKGQLQNVPREVSIRQVTYIVCVEDAMGQLVDDLEMGYIEIEKYRSRRKALWQILKFGIVMGFALLGGGALGIALAEKQIMGAIVSGVTAIYGIAICLGPLDDTMQQLIEGEDITIRDSSIPVRSHAGEYVSENGRIQRADNYAETDLEMDRQQTEAPDVIMADI